MITKAKQKAINYFESNLKRDYGVCEEYVKGCACCEAWKRWEDFKMRGEIDYQGQGSTPEEAVAKLWL